MQYDFQAKYNTRILILKRLFSTVIEWHNGAVSSFPMLNTVKNGTPLIITVIVLQME